MTNPRIIVINGPNLGMLGKRDPSHYGTGTLGDLERMISREAARLSCEIEFIQSDSEGDIITALHSNNGADAAILNAGAYSHYSIALRDAVECCGFPVVEVHISNIHAREEFRRKSVISPVCCGTISGFGFHGYVLALQGCLEILKSKGRSKEK